MPSNNLHNNGHPIYVNVPYQDGEVVCRGNCGGGGNPFFFLVLAVFAVALLGHLNEGNVKSSQPVDNTQQVTK